MNWFVLIWSMVVSACLTLAALHLLVWSKKRDAWSSFWFVLMAVGNAGLAGCEWMMAHAATPAGFATAARWLHVPTLLLVVALVGFVRTHLRAGSLRLAWAVCGLRTVSLVLNFVTGIGLNYRAITKVHRIPFLGDVVTVADGVPNPWMLVGQLSLVLLIAYAVGATVTVFRRGDRRLALATAGCIVFFASAAIVQAFVVCWSARDWPLIASWSFMAIIAVAAYALSLDVVRAAQLGDDLRAAEERYKSIFEGALEGMYRTSVQGQVLLANPALAEMLGYGSAEEVVREIQDTARQVWVSSEERAGFVERLEREGLVRRYECQFRRRDGSTIWVSLGSRVVRGPDGRVVWYDGFVDDIRERKRAEETLRTSQERLATGAELGGLGFYEIADGEDVRYADGPIRSLCGFPPGSEQGLAAFAFWLEHIHPDDVARITAAHEGLNNGSLDRITVEYRYLHPTRGEIWLHHLVVVMNRDAARRATYTIGVLRDVSEQKHAEAETGRLRSELAHFGRLAMMTQISSSLAHELNQPLGAILRNAEAAELLLEHPLPDLDEVRAILVDIRQDDQRAGAVIDRMRGMLRGRAAVRAPLDLDDLVRDVVALVRPDADRRRMQIAVEVPSDLPPVVGDRVQVQQVLLNLLLNAMDAVEANPRERRHVVASVGSASGAVEVSVRDNGSGIAADKLARVFEPFYTSKPNGMGMGLAISRSIVEAHGGRLWAQNNTDGGATFTFRLPAARTVE